MIDATAQKTIGLGLRTMYEVRPKGGIPDRIWRLLLAIEQATRCPPNAP